MPYKILFCVLYIFLYSVIKQTLDGAVYKVLTWMLSFLSSFVFPPNSQKFEQLVLTKLKWDLMAITPNAFLEHIFHRLPVDKEQAALLRKHAQTFIVLCATGKPIPSLIKQNYYELSINDTWWWIDDTKLGNTSQDSNWLKIN